MLELLKSAPELYWLCRYTFLGAPKKITVYLNYDYLLSCFPFISPYRYLLFLAHHELFSRLIYIFPFHRRRKCVALKISTNSVLDAFITCWGPYFSYGSRTKVGGRETSAHWGSGRQRRTKSPRDQAWFVFLLFLARRKIFFLVISSSSFLSPVTSNYVRMFCCLSI